MVVNDITAAGNSAQNKKSRKEADAAHLSPIGVSVRLSQIIYSGKPILEDLALNLDAGEMTCLLGPSGVGKTSILKTLAGLLPLAAGSTISASDTQNLRGRIAYMSQKDLLLPWATVIDNVLIGDRLKGRTPNIDKAKHLLELVGLADNFSNHPEQLSGGMRQRVALARTLMEDAPLILIDEPFSSLDAISRHRLQALLCKMTKGRTILMITHDPMEALRLADQIVVLSGTPPLATTIDRLSSEAPRELTDPDLKSRYDHIMSLLGMKDADR